MTSRKFPLPKRLYRAQYGLKGKRSVSYDTALLRELWLNVLPKNLELKTTDGSLDQNFRSTYTAVVSSNKQYICTTHGDHSVRISDTQRWTCKRAFVAHHRTPICARFHPVYTHIVASGCLAGEVYVFDIDNAAFEQMPIRSVSSITSLSFHPTAEILLASTAHALFIINWRQSVCLHTIDFESKFLLWMQFDSAGSNLYIAFESIAGERKQSLNDPSTTNSNNITFRRRPLLRLARSANRHNDAPVRNVVSAADVDPPPRLIRNDANNDGRIAERLGRARGHQFDDDSELVVHQLFRQAEAILHRLAATASRLGQENEQVDNPREAPTNQEHQPGGTTPRSTAATAVSNARMLNSMLERRPPIPLSSGARASGSSSSSAESNSATSEGENYSARMSELEGQIRETRRRLEQLRDSLHRIQEGFMPPIGNVNNRQAVEPPLARLRNRLLVPPAGPGVRALLDDLHTHYQQGPMCPVLFGEAPTELFKWDLEKSPIVSTLTDKDLKMERITECVVRGESAINLSSDGTRIACFVPSNTLTAANNLVLSSNSPISTPSARVDPGSSAPGSVPGRSPVVVVPGSPSLIRTMVAIFDVNSLGRYNKATTSKEVDVDNDKPSTSSAVTPISLSSSAASSNTYWLPIASTTFEGAGTSLSFSPDGNFIVVGFSLRSANISSLTSPVLRIFEINAQAGTLRTMCHIRHPTSEPFWELPRLAVNCVVWIDHSRGGIIYGTNQGHVVRCCPMSRSAFNEKNKASSQQNALSEHHARLANLNIQPSFVPIVPLDLNNLPNGNNIA